MKFNIEIEDIEDKYKLTFTKGDYIKKYIIPRNNLFWGVIRSLTESYNRYKETEK